MSIVYSVRVPPLPKVMLEPVVRMALLEDLGRAGDLTSSSIIPPQTQTTMNLVARQTGVLAGLELACLAFELLDENIKVSISRSDGARLNPGDLVASISG